MGNKATTLSSTESIQDLLDGNISLKKCTCEEVAKHLEIVIALTTHVVSGEIALSSKEYKDLIKVSTVITGILDDIYSGVVSDYHAYECKLKALQALIRLLVIPLLSKRTFEQSVVSIINHTNTPNAEVFTLAFIAFFNGFRCIDEESTIIGGLRAGGVEEASRNGICLQLDKMGLYPRLVNFLTQTSAKSQEYMTLTSILIFRFLSWTLTRTSSSTSILRVKLRQILLQHQDTLFELIRSDDQCLGDAAVNMIVLLLRLEDRLTCVAVQDAARGYGALLWALHRLTGLLIQSNASITQSAQLSTRSTGGQGGLTSASGFRAPTSSISSQSTRGITNADENQSNNAESTNDTESSALNCGEINAGVSVENVRGDEYIGSSHTGLVDPLFLPPMQPASLEERIHRTEILLSCLCIGNPVSTAVILLAFPSAMKQALYPSQSVLMRNVFRYWSPPEDRLLQYSGPFCEKMQVNYPAWYLLFGLLTQKVETPALVWNADMLGHLHNSLQKECDDLDFMRRLRHEAWDPSSLDVNYFSVYGKQKYIVVNGIFMHRAIDVLELGKTEYIKDPLAFAWALIDRALAPLNHPCSHFDESGLIVLRTLHLLLLRYHNDICEKIPVSALCAVLKMGLATGDRDCIVPDSSLAQWLHRCINILRLRRHSSSRSTMAEFASCSGVDMLITILSDYNIVENMCAFRAEVDDDDVDGESADESVHGDDAPDIDLTEKISSATLRVGSLVPNDATLVESNHSANNIFKRLSLNRSLRGTEKVDVSSPAASTHHVQKADDGISQYVVAGLADGVSVLNDTSTLLHALVHESSSCALHISSCPELFGRLIRAIWLLSCHGPRRPNFVAVALEKTLHVVLRVLHSSPEEMYSPMLLDTKILHIVFATGVSPSGEGCLSLAAAELISDIVVSIPEPTSDSALEMQRLPPSTCGTKNHSAGPSSVSSEPLPPKSLSDSNLESTTTTCSNAVSTKMSESTVMEQHSSRVQRRPSLRQALIHEGPKVLCADPFESHALDDSVSDRLIMGRTKRTIRSKRSPLPSVIAKLCSIVPLQLVRQCFELSTSLYCNAVFNASIAAPDVIWNTHLRQDLVVSLYDDLKEWHEDNFSKPIPSVDVLTASAQCPSERYAVLSTQPQLSGIFLHVLMRISNCKDLLGPFDVRMFSKDLLRALQRSLSALRIASGVSPSRSKSFSAISNASGSESRRRSSGDMNKFIPGEMPDHKVTDQIGPNSALLELKPERQASLLLLCLGKVVDMFPFPEDVWYDDAIPSLCNTIDSFSRAVSDSVLANNLCLSPLETCAIGVLTIVKSLYGAGFVQDDSVQQTQAKNFSKSLREFRADEKGMEGSLLLCKDCHGAVGNALRLCTTAVEEGKFFPSSEFNVVVDVLLSSATVLLVHVACQSLALTKKSCDGDPTDSRNAARTGTRSLHASGNAENTSSDSTGQVRAVPVEVKVCLRTLLEGGIFGELVRCTRLSVARSSPYATLHSLISLRLFLIQAGEEASSLLLDLSQKGLPLFLLDTMLALLTDDLPSFSANSQSWAHHPALDSPDMFSEKVLPPLNRKKGHGDQQDTRSYNEVSCSSPSVPLLDACKDVLLHNESRMVNYISKSGKESAESAVCTDKESPRVVSSRTEVDELLSESMKCFLIRECVLLLRNLVISAFDSNCDSSNTSSDNPVQSATAMSPSQPVSSSKRIKNPYLVELLELILTPSLLHVLRYNLGTFVEIIRATKPTKRPLAIWTSGMLATLKSFLGNEIKKITALEQSSESPVLFDIQALLSRESSHPFHPCVADEVVIDGVYINLLLDPVHRDDIGARNLPEFVEILQASVTSSKRVLELVKQRRQSLSGKNSLTSQLSIKQQVLDHIIRQHPELGYSDLYVVDEQNY